jgi:tetratricopeptide (TPR) repeat protein
VKTFGLAAALAGLTLAVFFPVLGHDFLQYDDAVYVTENPHLRGGLSPRALAWAFRPYEANWIPATWISLQLDWTLFGPSARAFHATNLGLHLTTTLVLFLLLARLTRRRGAAAFVAAVFAIHPLHVESVAWVAERKDTLSGFFFVLALAAHAHYAARPSAPRYVGALVLAALGLLAKPMLVTLPAVLLLFDLWPLDRPGQRVSWRRLLLEKLPYAGLAAGAAFATLSAQASYGALATEGVLSLPVRFANALAAYAAYLADAVWPRGLAVFYPHPRESVSAIAAALGAAGLVLGTVIAVALRRRAPAFGVGWLWFVGMLVPVLGLVQVGLQARADRYTYLPLIGLAIAAAFPLAAWADSRARQRGLAWVGVGLVLALAGASRLQVAHWRDTESLFRHAAAVTEANFLAHQWIGSALLRRHALDEAREAFGRALALRPGWAKAHQGLADIDAERGHWDAAVRGYERALRFAPKEARVHLRLARALAASGQTAEALGRARHAVTLGHGIDRLDALAILGAIHTDRGETDEALAVYDRALASRPRNAALHGARGLALLRGGRADDAETSLEHALALGATDPLLHLALGDAVLRRGRSKEALAHYEAALARAGDDPQALQHTATLLASARPGVADPERALRLAERALALTGPTAESLAAEAEARAALGDAAGAVASSQRAEAHARETGRGELADRIRARRAQLEPTAGRRPPARAEPSASALAPDRLPTE